MTLLLGLALAGAPAPVDAADAAWLTATMRGDAALPFLAEQLAAAPDDPELVIGWLSALMAGRVSRDARLAALPLAERWAAEHPDVEARGAVVALARAVVSSSPKVLMYPIRGYEGPWCEQAAIDLAVTPEDPDARYVVLHTRAALSGTCGWDDSADALRTHAATADVNPGRQLWARLDDPASAALVPLVEATDPHRFNEIGRWMMAQRATVAEPVRVALHDAAVRLAADGRPSRLAAAARLFQALQDRPLEVETRRRLLALDPRDRDNRARIESLDGVTEPPPRPPHDLDPAARLAALDAAQPSKRDSWWARSQHVQARADALFALDEEAKALSALRVGRRAGLVPAERFAHHALRTGHHLGFAARQLAEQLADAPTRPLAEPGVSAAERAADDRRALAASWATLAQLHEALKRHDDAHDALEAALRLDPDAVDVRLRLGLVVADEAPARARDLLVGALTSPTPADPDLERRARERLVALLPATGAWLPAGVHGYLEAVRALRGEPPTAETPLAPGRDLPDVSFTVDGAAMSLSDVEGPVVIDLWATWCEPCLVSLPHLDDLARRFGDRVTFIALSTDRTYEAMTRWQEHQRATSFRVAWGGEPAKEALGVSSIPHTLVLDADHRVVADLIGYSGGDTRLDAALDRLLDRR